MKKLGMIAAFFCASICTGSEHSKLQRNLLATYTLLSCLDGSLSRDKAFADMQKNEKEMKKLAKKNQQNATRNRYQLSAADCKKQNNRKKFTFCAPHQK
jgi:hypothetical protein